MICRYAPLINITQVTCDWKRGDNVTFMFAFGYFHILCLSLAIKFQYVSDRLVSQTLNTPFYNCIALHGIRQKGESSNCRWLEKKKKKIGLWISYKTNIWMFCGFAEEKRHWVISLWYTSYSLQTILILWNKEERSFFVWNAPDQTCIERSGH